MRWLLDFNTMNALMIGHHSSSLVELIVLNIGHNAGVLNDQG